MRKIAALLGLVAAAWMFTPTAPPANAGPGGTWPAPGLCDYPGVGQSGLVGVVPYYFCDFPTEANGTHWHCEAGGVSVGGGAFTGTSGLGVGGLGNFGFAFGSCYFKWPDGTLAPPPNPPGAWKNFMVPRPVPVEHAAPPQPYDQTIDVAPQPVDEGAPLPAQNLPPPVVAPPTIAGPVRPDSPELLPQPPTTGEPVPHDQTPGPVTNPALPNPRQQQNPRY